LVGKVGTRISENPGGSGNLSSTVLVFHLGIWYLLLGISVSSLVAALGPTELKLPAKCVA